MSETLLEAARREFPGAAWTGAPKAVWASIEGIRVCLINCEGCYERQYGAGRSWFATVPESFAWLRAQLAAQRDACDKALGGGWRRFGDCRPEEGAHVLLHLDGPVPPLVVRLFDGLWINNNYNDLRRAYVDDLWHPLPELPEVGKCVNP